MVEKAPKSSIQDIDKRKFLVPSDLTGTKAKPSLQGGSEQLLIFFTDFSIKTLQETPRKLYENCFFYIHSCTIYVYNSQTDPIASRKSYVLVRQQSPSHHKVSKLNISSTPLQLSFLFLDLYII